MDRRSHPTVTGRLWSDVLLLLALVGILLIGAPRLAVYYKTPRVVDPSVETTNGSSLHALGSVRREDRSTS